MRNIVFLMTACKKSGPVQQMLSIIKHLDRKEFNPYLVTLYDEATDGSSQLQKYIAQGVKHIFVPLSKKKILLGQTENLKNVLDELKPDAIHSLGVFPDFALSRLHYPKHLTTLRNYVYEDYIAKFGKVKGLILAKLHLYAAKRADKVLVCSRSLASKYKEKLHLDFPFIQNGVELDKYHNVTEEEKKKLRKKLNILQDSVIFTYSGQFIDRKDQQFLISVFSQKAFQRFTLILLGDGPNYNSLNQTLTSNIIMPGAVNNVNEFLQASDVYISSSKSEGLPNGVLEAMASGLPVVLSDIEQHKELFDSGMNIGLMYKLGDKTDCERAILQMISMNLTDVGNVSSDCAREKFSASRMSLAYQKEYLSLSN